MPEGLGFNPLPGDESHALCVLRQMVRGASFPEANKACEIMSTVLHANGEQDPNVVLVPVTFTKEGVHNGAYKPWSAIRNAAKTLLGTPFFINGPGEHEQGVWPPLGDKTKWHGYVANVEIDEQEKRLFGNLALYTPDALTRNGANPARIKFQTALLEAIKVGGKFDVSAFYGAKTHKENGTFANKEFTRVEDLVVFNSISLVPLGAEPTAIMNAMANLDEETGDDGDPEESDDLVEEAEEEATANAKGKKFPKRSFAYVGNDGKGRLLMADLAGVRNALSRFGQATTIPPRERGRVLRRIVRRAKKMGVDVPDSARERLRKLSANVQVDEPIYTAPEKTNILSMTPEIDQFVASANIETLAQKSPSVAALVKDHDKATANVKDIEAAKAKVEVDLADARKQTSELTAEVNAFRKAKTDALTARIATAEKTLAKGPFASRLPLFKDPKDLEGTANRLEGLVSALPGLTAVGITPPAEDLAAAANLEDNGAGAPATEQSVEEASFNALQEAFAPQAKAPQGGA